MVQLRKVYLAENFEEQCNKGKCTTEERCKDQDEKCPGEERCEIKEEKLTGDEGCKGEEKKCAGTKNSKSNGLSVVL